MPYRKETRRRAKSCAHGCVPRHASYPLYRLLILFLGLRLEFEPVLFKYTWTRAKMYHPLKSAKIWLITHAECKTFDNIIVSGLASLTRMWSKTAFVEFLNGTNQSYIPTPLPRAWQCTVQWLHRGVYSFIIHLKCWGIIFSLWGSIPSFGKKEEKIWRK